MGRVREEGAELADVLGEHTGDPGGALALQVVQPQALDAWVQLAAPVVLHRLAELAPGDARAVGERRDGSADDGRRAGQRPQLGGGADQADPGEGRALPPDQDEGDPADEEAEGHLRHLPGDRQHRGQRELPPVRADDLEQGVPRVLAVALRDGPGPVGAPPAALHDEDGGRRDGAEADQRAPQQLSAAQREGGHAATGEQQLGAAVRTTPGRLYPTGRPVFSGIPILRPSDFRELHPDRRHGTPEAAARLLGIHRRVMEDKNSPGDGIRADRGDAR